jgi:hypothetical protein
MLTDFLKEQEAMPTPFYDGSISAMNPLFPTLQESENLISIYSSGIRDFNP